MEGEIVFFPGCKLSPTNQDLPSGEAPGPGMPRKNEYIKHDNSLHEVL
jgi:hypothetical protein